jgi:hypothetical protein
MAGLNGEGVLVLLRERVGSLWLRGSRCLRHLQLRELPARMDEHVGRVLLDHTSGPLRDHRREPADRCAGSRSG